MSAHLLQISAERLATLPEGLLARASSVNGWDGRTFKRPNSVVVRFDHGAEVDTVRGSAWLVLTDTVTAAVVAARIVRPWLMEQGSRSGREFGDVDALAEHHGSLSAALLMQPLTPDQREELTRLARAAMEGA